MDELKEKLLALKTAVDDLINRLKLADKKTEIQRLQRLTTDPGFWSNDQEAKRVTKALADLEEEVTGIEELDKKIVEQQELLNLTSSDDRAMKMDLEKATADLERQLNKWQMRLFLGGKYDAANAIIAIHAGQGGTEACDWAAMLKRMYLRFIERKGWQAELINESLGEEAGIKSVTYLVTGKYTYGYLKGEAGTHRLVRLSPFNADNLRQTSFALVETLPEIEEAENVEIREEDLEWQFFRSGGKGGQNVNKVSTAVRLRHIPSGIVIESQTQRYQEQNRKMALSVLKAKLWQQEEQKRQTELTSLKGTKMASWGSQIRSYVLHPYHLVKDVRTEVEMTDTEAVLDGELDQFIEAEIKL